MKGLQLILFHKTHWVNHILGILARVNSPPGYPSTGLDHETFRLM